MGKANWNRKRLYAILFGLISVLISGDLLHPAPKQILNEKFSHNRNMWHRSRNSYIAQSRYIIYKKDGYFIASMDPRVLKRYAFINGTITVETTWEKGVTDKGYGILFRAQDTNNFHYFIISAEGKFSVGYRKGSTWNTLVDWKDSDAINKKGTNTLDVECEGDSFTGYINGTKVFSVENGDIQGGLFALIADSVQAHFDNLIVWREKEEKKAEIPKGRDIQLTGDLERTQERMFQALQKGDASFFSNVSGDTFEKINVGKYRTAIYEYCVANKEHIVSSFIPALLGGFRNRDIRVRRAIYRELTFGYDNKLLHSIDFNLLYGTIIRQRNAKNTFRQLYNTAFARRDRERGNHEVWESVVDLMVYCQYALKSDAMLREVMMNTGIKPGLQVYFHKIMWEHLKRVNTLPGTSETYMNRIAKGNQKNLARYMWIYMGGLRNSDPRVRTVMYRELMFPGISNPLERIKSHKNGKKWLMKFRLLLSRREEEDSGAKKYYDMVKEMYAEK